METRRGKLLGRYEIVDEIGRGAMGTVYKARDPKIDRFVAIKTILLHQSGLQEQYEFRKRFFLEAQAAGRLLHPGIVTVFDVGEEPETSDPYIVMEYIEGQTLRDLLDGDTKRLPLERALQITIEIAEALDYAHAQSVVHRDIKPANILITRDGQAKIGDFGIAQIDLAHITLPGNVVGTPAYMSPEQLEGEQVDGRSDLFSVGAILYLMLTGFSPFQGNSATTVSFQVVNRNPLQVTTLVPELPVQLDVVIGRALAKDRTHRYQRGMEFALDLKELRERAADHAKAKLWFSPPESRKGFLEGTAKLAVTPATQPPKKVVKPQPPSTPAARKGFSIFSFSPLQTGVAVIALFLASSVLGVFSWREIRKPHPGPSAAVADANLASIANPAPKRNAPTVPEARSQTDAVADTQTAALTDPAAPTPAAASRPEPPRLSSPKAGATPKAAAQAGSEGVNPAIAKDLVHAPKNIVPAASRSVAKAGVVPVVAKSTPNPAPDAAPVPQRSSAIADSNLEIHVENHFADAILALWIDDRLSYEHPLHDGHKKRLLLLGGGVRESITIPLASGKHGLRVQVRSASEQYDQSINIDGEFLQGGEKVLSVNFDKHTKDMRVALGSEATATPKPEPAQP